MLAEKLVGSQRSRKAAVAAYREAGKQPAPDRKSGWEADEHARDPDRRGDGQ
jgi:hypothetical protein